MASRTSAHVLTFGAEADVSWRGVKLDELARPSFELGYGGVWHRVRLLQSGMHQISNATAAAAMALAAGRSLKQIAIALSEATAASPWRMELRRRDDGLLVINDTYNANPASMLAAIEALATIGKPRNGRTIAVLGEMHELGADFANAYRELGRAAAGAAIDLVLTVGAGAAGIADGVRDAGSHAAVRVDDVAGALDWLAETVRPDDVVLVKASRGEALDKAVTGLLAYLNTVSS